MNTAHRSLAGFLLITLIEDRPAATNPTRFFGNRLILALGTRAPPDHRGFARLSEYPRLPEFVNPMPPVSDSGIL